MKRVREVPAGAGPGVLVGAAVGVAFGGLLLFLWVLVASVAPAADAYAPAVVNMSTIAPGERRTVPLPGRHLVFIVHRTPEQIAAVRADDDAPMPSPQPDAERVQRAEWLVVEARPEGSWFTDEFGMTSPEGKYGGWYAHPGDQHYELSGRLRERYRGTSNLPVPDYYFVNHTTLVIE